jgi:hypothetical protein
VIHQFKKLQHVQGVRALQLRQPARLEGDSMDSVERAGVLASSGCSKMAYTSSSDV